MSPKKSKKLVIIYGIIAFSAMQIIKVFLFRMSPGTNAVPVVLWSYINYRILIKDYDESKDEELKREKEREAKRLEEIRLRNEAHDAKVLELQQKSEELVKESIAAPGKNADAPSKKRFCKYCGSEVDPVTKKCSGCGRQYLKIDWKLIVIFALIVVLISLVVFFAVNIANINEDYTFLRHLYSSRNKGFVYEWNVFTQSFDRFSVYKR